MKAMHWRPAMLVALPLLACTPDDGPTALDSVGAAIYHGTRELERPSVVAVYFRRPGTETLRLCSGTVIAPRRVVTAKHCVFDEGTGDEWAAVPAADIVVTVGDAALENLCTVTQAVGVAEVMTTAGPYRRDDALAGDDIAVLALSEEVAAPAVRVTVGAPEVGLEVEIVGFGFTEDDELGVKYAGAATVDVVGEGVFETEGDAWTCTGDSGGPAFDVATGGLVGVTSIGPRGCRTSRSIYTRGDRHLGLLGLAQGSGDAGTEEDGGALAVDAEVRASEDGGPSGDAVAMSEDSEGGCTTSPCGGSGLWWPPLLAWRRRRASPRGGALFAGVR